MVEKIIINPTKVRGYGNILNVHTSTDYTNYACTLTEETDTVNGAETTVNKITDTILWFDKGITAVHNDHYYYNSNNGSVTPTTTGTKVLNTTGNTTFIDLYPIPLDQTVTSGNIYKWNAPLIIEFDITEANGTNGDTQVQVYSATTSANCFENINSDTGHWRVELYNDNTQKIYLDGTLKKSTSLTLTNARIGLRARNGKYVTYKNFKIWEG